MPPLNDRVIDTYQICEWRLDHNSVFTPRTQNNSRACLQLGTALSMTTTDLQDLYSDLDLDFFLVSILMTSIPL
jgi:hypothetical protein